MFIILDIEVFIEIESEFCIYLLLSEEVCKVNI